MNAAEILRGLLRRWYVVVPGIVLSVALAFVTWTNVEPAYERTGRQLLLPGNTSIPEGGNPYLYIGGLSQAADVVVLALGSANVLDEIAEEHPDVTVEVTRDTSTSSPVIVTTVTAPSDAEAEEVLGTMVDQTATILTDLQDQQSIASDNRISVNTVTVDGQSVVQQKDRMISAAAVGAVGVVLSILLAALIDGLIISRRRRYSAGSRSRAARAEEDAGDDHRSRSGAESTWLDTDDPETAPAEEDEADSDSAQVAAEQHHAVTSEESEDERESTSAGRRGIKG